MSKVLIITYYWPPAGGGGVQRWLKFVKYLPEFGWQPVIFAPSNADYPLHDETLTKEIPEGVTVIRRPIFEPRRIYQKLLRLAGHKQSSTSTALDSIVRKPQTSMSWHQKVALRIRSNLFIPDARSPWIRPSARFLKKYLRENPVDLIITTGPPHTCHLIGLALKRALGIKWIADFRDPWLDIEFFPMLQLTAASRKKHERLQSEVLTSADLVITVSWSWADLLRSYGAHTVGVLTNGFDIEDVEHVVVERKPDKIIFASVGTMEEDRNPHDLWAALSRLLQEQPALEHILELHLIGRLDEAVLHAIKDERVHKILHLHGYVSHATAMQLMCSADALILSLNKSHASNAKGLVPGKVFEYIATGNAILVTGDQGSDVGKIVSKYGNGFVVNDGDIEALYENLKSIVEAGLQGTLRTEMATSTNMFERKQLTKTLVEMMQTVI